MHLLTTGLLSPHANLTPALGPQSGLLRQAPVALRPHHEQVFWMDGLTFELD